MQYLKRRPLKNANFCSSSRKAIILTTGSPEADRGLKFEPDTEIGQISADFEKWRFAKVSKGYPMTDNQALTPDQIKKAAEAIKSLRPVYATMLDFYEKIFTAQEKIKGQVQIEPIKISDEMLSVKAKEQFPLINVSDFIIDSKASRLLLIQICNMAKEDEGDMAASAKALAKAIETETIDPDALFYSLFEGGASFFEKTAGKFEIDKKILAFITYSSIKPSLTICAEQLAHYLDKLGEWDKGYCPVCGSLPGLSMFKGEGERFLFCGFCWHKWPSKRLYCPFCENKESKSLQYFFIEEEKEYRVDLCDECKKYIKTVDTRKTDRYIYPPLELVSTLHLDIKARETGFESGMQLLLQGDL